MYIFFMDFEHFTAGEDDSGRRLDKVLRRFLSDESLSALYKSLRKGLIKVNGKKCEAGIHLEKGDDIQVASFLCGRTHGAEDVMARRIPEELVLFRNEHLLILNKPYDVPVQPSPSSGIGNALSEQVEADYEFFHPEKESLAFRTGPLHRLDRKTTGIIVFSQSIYGARNFSELIQSHGVKKIYVGIAEGKLPEKKSWKDNLERDGDSSSLEGGKMFHTVSVSTEGNSGKAADTVAVPLAYGNVNGKDVTLVEYVIGTGRTHQIRAQTSHHGFPLLGDVAYGSKYKSFTSAGQDFYLHAYELRFPSGTELGVPEKITAFISTKFEKMLSSALIKWDGSLII